MYRRILALERNGLKIRFDFTVGIICRLDPEAVLMIGVFHLFSDFSPLGVDDGTSVRRKV